jgi:sigma-B regulation protein RsbU (phosphoserine phosphatase)
LDRFDSYFTIAYVCLNVKTGRLTYSNAGHVPPLVLRKHGRLDTLAHHGTVIGSGLETAFGQETTTLAPGDRLILYTDGLTDNFGPDGEREGRVRLENALRGLIAKPADELVQAIIEQSRMLRDGLAPTDDMSLMAIEYRG